MLISTSMEKHYREEFRRWQTDGFGTDPAGVRLAALEKFITLGWPNNRQEAWRFTSVSDLEKERFSWPGEIPASNLGSDIAAARIPGAWTVVMVNGRIDRDLPSRLPEGILLSGLSDIADLPDKSIPEFESNPFYHWNTAFFQPGICLEVESGVALDRPIQIIWLTTGRDMATAAHSRIQVNIGENSRFTLVEHFISKPSESTLTNHVSRIQMNSGAGLDYIKIQAESMKARHFHLQDIRLATGCRIQSTQFALGGRLSRTETALSLSGEDCEAQLNILGLQSGSQHTDSQTIIHHEKPRGTSRENVKNVLRDSARAVFNGQVRVARGAWKTDAVQSNKNLLLSDSARVNANPQLEILADDVSCAHGSSTGALDEDVMFYLQSRGIEPNQARNLMISGFITDIVDQVSQADIKPFLENLVAEWLGKA